MGDDDEHTHDTEEVGGGDKSEEKRVRPKKNGNKKKCKKPSKIKVKKNKGKEKKRGKKKLWTKNHGTKKNKNKSSKRYKRELRNEFAQKISHRESKKLNIRQSARNLVRHPYRFDLGRKMSKAEKERQRLLRNPAKFSSGVYSSRAAQVIEDSDTSRPFFIYLSLFTKSYPREITNRKGSMEEAVTENRRRKLEDLDTSVDQVVRALRSSGHYDNTVIIFLSDNGARRMVDTSLPNPNHPLRGSKGSVYEGGTKVPAFVHSPLLGQGLGRYTSPTSSSTPCQFLLHSTSSSIPISASNTLPVRVFHDQYIDQI